LFALVLLVMIEAAALLRGPLLLGVCLAQLGGYLALELVHPTDDLPVVVRLATAVFVAVAVRIVASIVDEERDRVRRLTVGLRAVIWEFARTGRLICANDGAARLFGSARNTIAEMLQLSDTSFVDQLFAAGAAETQLQVQTAGGRSLWLQVSGRV